MGSPRSREFLRLFTEANDLAKHSKKPLGTIHLLLSFFTAPNDTVFLLEERGLNEDSVLDQLGRLPAEAAGTMEEVYRRVDQYTRRSGSREASPFHLLIALCRVQHSRAYQALQAAGVDVAAIRSNALSFVTGAPPRRPDQTRESAPSEDRPIASGQNEPRRETSERPAQNAETSARKRPQPVELEIEPPGAPEPGTTGRGPVSPANPFSLDKKQFPILCKLGRNLTELAFEHAFDPLIGRDKELERMVDVLGKRRANNPCLVGEAGVGKTAIAEGLANLIAHKKAVPASLRDKLIIELDTGSLLAGTQLRGSFAEKMQAIKGEVRRAQGRVIIFIDELHTLIGAGASDGPFDAANELKSALARGEFPCIGATTVREYKKYVEADPALERRFQAIMVEEPQEDDAVTIVSGIIPRYEGHHHVRYTAEAIRGAVRLTARYVNDRCLPDKAIHALDLAGARASRRSQREVELSDVAEVVSDAVNIPMEKLLLSDAQRLIYMSDFLGHRVVGHRQILDRIAAVIRRNYAGFRSDRPIGSFLFLGPTGVGKTELAKALAEFLFQRSDALIRFDMSEFMEGHAAAKLIGAPPGYVGYEEGGVLTEALHKRPYRVILFDEVEKASKDVLNLLLQLLDEGQLTDGRGKKVDFSNTVIAMTSNLGSDTLLKSSGGGFGFGLADEPADAEERSLASARKAFAPELWNRIDEKLVFLPLQRDQVREIARLLVRNSSAALEAEKQISFDVSDAAVEFVLEHGGFDAALGARPMRQAITRLVEARIADWIISGEIVAKQHVTIDAIDGQLQMSTARTLARAGVLGHRGT